MLPTVFIVSDGTGITAETFAHSILSQFDQKFRLVRVPFVDSLEKAYSTVEKINEAAVHDGRRAIVFTTLVDSVSNDIVKRSNALVLDMFQRFVEPLEQELELKSSHAMGAATRTPIPRNTRRGSRRSTSRSRTTTASRTATCPKPT
jgi:regulator of PEP synthase PpsR (kinase-PPPase family)